RGELFGIYPEGTRSRDGRLYKGHTGPARLALRTGAPLVPVGIVGTRDIQPPSQAFPRLFRPCEIRIGRPIDVASRRRSDERLLLRQVTDELMYEIRELTGQEYVDEYATRRHEALPASPPAITASAAGNGERGAGGGEPVRAA